MYECKTKEIKVLIEIILFFPRSQAPEMDWHVVGRVPVMWVNAAHDLHSIFHVPQDFEGEEDYFFGE